MPINELTASAPASPDATLSSQDAEIYDHLDWRHARLSLFGRRLSVASFGASKFLIGVQIASLLRRETFNMYRSMKIKSVDIQRASPQQVDFLAKVNAVRPGTHSVTLIPFDDGLYFVADAWVKQHKEDVQGTKGSMSPLSVAAKAKSSKSFIQERPKIHRRKPLPWDLHRSIKKNDVKDPSKFILLPDLPLPSTSTMAFYSSASSPSASASSPSQLSSSMSAPCSPVSPTELLTAAADSLAAADILVQQSHSSTPLPSSSSSSSSSIIPSSSAAFFLNGASHQSRAFFCR